MGNKIKRIDYLDVAKGLAILAVVTGHALTNNEDIFKTSHPAIINWISFFNVATFCFVNGFLYSEKTVAEPVKSLVKKVKTYYIPYLCFNFFFFICHNLFVTLHFSKAAKMHGAKTIAVNFGKMLFGKLQILTGPLWFLRALLVMTVIYIVLDSISSRIAKGRFRYIINAVVIVAIWILGTRIRITETFNLKDGCRFLVLFYIGVLYRKFDLNRFVEKKAVIWFVIFLAISVYLAITTYLGLKANQDYTMYLAVRVVGTFMVIAAAQLPLINGSKLLKLLGKSSMYIMALHFIAFKLVSMLIMKIYGFDTEVLSDTPVIRNGDLSDLWVPVYVCVGVVIPVVVYLVKNKITSGMKNR